MVPEIVAILLAGSVESGVKVFRALPRRQDANVFGKKSVNGQSQFRWRNFEFMARNLDMRDHPEGMDAGVRAAGTVNAADGWKELGEGLFHFLLHAQAGLLHLPAGVVRAVVGDGEFDFDSVHRRKGL